MVLRKIYICIRVYKYVHTHTHVRMNTYPYTYAHTHICAHACTHTHAHTHTSIHTHSFSRLFPAFFFLYLSLSLAYTNRGTTPIVFCHGLGIGYLQYMMLLQKLPRDGDVYLLDFPNITMALGAGIFVFLLPRDMYLLDVPSFSANLGAGLYFWFVHFFLIWIYCATGFVFARFSQHLFDSSKYWAQCSERNVPKYD